MTAQRPTVRWNRRVTVVLVAVITVVLVGASPASAGGGGPRSVYVDPIANSALYERLAARWWQWAIGTPVTPRGPFSDTKQPIDCGLNQPSRDVLFLAAPFNSSGSVSRTCRAPIPRTTRVFLPVINVECSNLESGTDWYGETPEARLACVRKDIFAFDDLRATVDGRPLPVSDGRFTILTDDFAIHAVEGNPAGVPAPGDGWSTSRGVWVLLNPLSPGRHQITFGGSFPDYPPPPGFSVSANYTLTVA